ncbi:MAG: hypothetical protein HUJ93_04835 [Bacteroidales bacterium]|nr:hypothetical protein [Bacteroidales bacterium]
MENNDWLKSLKDRVERCDSFPEPTTSWEAIEADMDAMLRRRKIVRTFGAVIAGAAALASIFLILPESKETSETELIPLADNAVPEVARSSEAATEATLAEVMAAENISQFIAQAVTGEIEDSAATEVVAAADMVEVEEAEAEQASPGRVEAVRPEFNQSEEKSTPEEKVAATISFDDFPIEKEPSHSRSRRASIALSAGSKVQGISVFEDAVAGPIGSDIAKPGDSGESFLKPDPIQKPIPEKKEATLGIPLSFGLSLRYDISRLLFVTAGVSAAIRDVSGLGISDRQFWSVGPSAGVGINLFDREKVNLYVAASGDAGWSVTHKDFPMICSAGVALGGQIRLGGAMWLYAEPQFRYSFKTENGSCRAIYSDPRQFALNIGLRLDLQPHGSRN